MLSRIVLITALLFSNVAIAADTTTKPWVPAKVTMEIRHPDGTVTVYTDAPWSLGMTVLDTMKEVDGIKFTGKWYRSLGDWLITSNDGVVGQETAGPNWNVCVDGYPAGTGPGSFKLGPNASILWIYTAKYPLAETDCK